MTSGGRVNQRYLASRASAIGAKGWGRTGVTTDLAPLHDRWLVVEAVIEDVPPRQAKTFLDARELVAGHHGFAGVAAALAVLSGIAAADAACCARLGEHHEGQDHRGAISLLETVDPGGDQMARDLQRLLDRKDDEQNGFTGVGAADERAMISWARRLDELASTAAAA